MNLNLIKYHGGKGRLIKKILPIIPDHNLYLEPYLGGGSILLNKEKKKEIANDLNPNLILMWQAVQSGLLIKEVEKIVYNIENFEAALNNEFAPYLNTYILYRMSRGGLCKNFAWSDRLRGGIPGDINAWENAKKKMPLIQKRIENVEFKCMDALTLLQNYNSNDVCAFLDPPYIHSTRTTTKEYGPLEMQDSVHTKLCLFFSTSKMKLILCGYENDLYANIIGKPNFIFDVPNNSGQNKLKQRRRECLWINF